MSDEPIPLGRLTRRGFLRAGALSAVGVALPACESPEHIVPYVERPPEVTPGISRYYATAALRAGLAVGLLAESRAGRPIKIEGNPEHPSSLGATGPVEQALSYTLYDPDRLGTVERRGAPSSFEAFARTAAEGLHIWMPATSSPLMASLLDRLRERHPDARITFDPSGLPLPEWEATRQVFGRVLAPRYRFERADRVLALDADFLVDDPGSIRWSRDWASRRTADGAMSRCYAVDATPTCTSVSFDHRLTVRSSEIGRVAAGVLAALEGRGVEGPHRAWIEAVASDLAAHRGRSIVLVGPRQPAHVHVLALAINAALESFGRTIDFTRSPWLSAGEPAFDPGPLMDALDAGAVETLVCLGGNPAYTERAARFGERARRAKERVVLSLFPDETARLATWRLPALHPLERWGDARGHDGTWTTIQPLIRPLFGGHAPEEVLLALSGAPEQEVRPLLEASLRAAGHDPRAVLSRGFVEASALPVERVEASAIDVAAALAEVERTALPADAYELELRPDPRIGDGAHAENAWLQELPETMTKLVWDNAALMSPADVAALELTTGDVVELDTEHGAVQLPVLPVEGQAERTIITWLGYGRRDGGRGAKRVGVDVAALRSAPWMAASLRRTGGRYELARTQRAIELPPDEVPVVLRTTLDAYRRDPRFAQPHDEDPPSLHPVLLHGSPQWGMAVDLSRCTGCQACVIACQVENNVPVVGKAQVALGREMHWLRIDRYVDFEAGETRTSLQPMLCVHCEKAPCEYVCPVNATVHSPDGLNEMVYNRCVGTRFCSNNCPYKVRRFNWYDFHAQEGEPETFKHNPDVTVRARGVMEKCTYCVQRIRRAEIDAGREHRALRDGDVVTACAQACPTDAIVFGDVSDREARVTRLHHDPRAYGVLNQLGTRPRTRHLARIDNLNPELTGE